jgi:hypothetical protein
VEPDRDQNGDPRDRRRRAATGEARWDELWQESAAWLDCEWEPDSGVWTQGALRFEEPSAAAVTRRYAVEERGVANWPPEAEGSLRARDGQIRVQWCHGAPGIVASLAALAPDDAEHDRLLRAGGELVWRAGPLAKGANLCHGTAGNGYAFLALLERTGDELWLERARAFAMHAAAQVSRERGAYGRGRYSLWTGDLGTALYLADCLAGAGALPLP